ncbi:RNA polymerase sigma factor [Diplocloster agilis]|uniref:Sigma-70 family RNA polymerase sigma factor n=1 Tax=Diplocloster agilis TaxID=2850323 RepID=A0A949JXQ5_9FIRM|nr:MULTISPECIES: sigma-70 family RNA polymerase sigma factor [Lachnospiraceae]MBU9737123.1 sigma-70 family RNA polymerase sigma factor [Diplocloster agilis]MBU9744318.1 sigma-70 family RNA polymerase sigma factor [Diplocloster agilis]MCU6737018.1 sigma-70 family RNA polymerase sigma factor [Suonthocola fibrivorans]SCJ95260.1 RNA polymerase sigma factor sigV [uncultured Clostridium sp.]
MDIGKEAFCDYIEQYQRRMFRVARGILYHDEDAEDAVGESILKAYEKRNQLKNPDKFRPWIMKIVVHESYRIARKRGRTDYLEDSPGTEIPTEDSHYELWDLVNTLDEEFRVVTILFYYEDLSLKEIGMILDIPVGTVKSRLTRARAKLKHLI